MDEPIAWLSLCLRFSWRSSLLTSFANWWGWLWFIISAFVGCCPKICFVNEFYCLYSLYWEVIKTWISRVAISIVKKLKRFEVILFIKYPYFHLQTRLLFNFLLSFRQNYATLPKINLHVAIRQPEEDSLLFYSHIFNKKMALLLNHLVKCLKFQKIRRNLIRINRYR